MRLLLLTYEYPPQKGGIATYLSNLVAAAPSGIEVTVAVPRKSEHWTQTIWCLCLKRHHDKPDLIAISHVLPAGYVALNAKFWYRTPYVVITHGTDILTARRSAWKRLWMRFILKRARFVIANSRFTASLLKEEGIRRVEIVPPGIDASSRPRLAKKNTATIISVGRLVPRKGFDALIRTLPSVIKEVPAARLVIVGKGDYLEELDRLAHELRVENFVDFKTDAADEEKARLLDTAAVFALAGRRVKSDVEGFGIVTLEASAAGLPVVVSDSGGAAEPVVDGATGLIIESGDEQALAKALVRLLKDPAEAERMGTEGRRYVQEEYSIAKSADRFWKLVTDRS